MDRQDTSPRASDQELLSRMAGRDSHALTEIYDRYVSVSLALAHRILGDPTEGEDVIQEVFVRIWQGAERYDPNRGSVATWILSFVRNAAIDRLRRRDAYRRATRQAVPRVDPDLPPAGSDELSRAIEVLKSLPNDQREAIELAYFEGLTQSQIAAKLSLPLGTVKARIRLGMSKLRQAMLGLSEEIA
jgi:RNA polymerase sigma-70 factor (ECF subfamily)